MSAAARRRRRRRRRRPHTHLALRQQRGMGRRQRPRTRPVRLRQRCSTIVRHGRVSPAASGGGGRSRGISRPAVARAPNECHARMSTMSALLRPRSTPRTHLPVCAPPADGGGEGAGEGAAAATPRCIRMHTGRNCPRIPLLVLSFLSFFTLSPPPASFFSFDLDSFPPLDDFVLSLVGISNERSADRSDTDTTVEK